MCCPIDAAIGAANAHRRLTCGDEWCCAQRPPQYVIVENVVGFEGSRMRFKLARALDAAGLDMQVNTCLAM